VKFPQLNTNQNNYKMTNNEKEWGILVCLFKATVEQQSMLIGVPKQQAKVIFNRWMKEGEKLLKIVESATDQDNLEIVTSVIENSINELRTATDKV